MRRLSKRNARRWTHEVAAWTEYARVTWGIGNRRRGYVGPNLKGGCWIASFILVHKLASFILVHKLRTEGYRAGIVYDEINRHAFVQTACGWFLDPTFAQFAVQYGFPATVLFTCEPMDADRGVIGLSKHPWGQTIDRIVRRMGLPKVRI